MQDNFLTTETTQGWTSFYHNNTIKSFHYYTFAAIARFYLTTITLQISFKKYLLSLPKPYITRILLILFWINFQETFSNFNFTTERLLGAEKMKSDNVYYTIPSPSV